MSSLTDKEKLDVAVQMLAEWVVVVHENGPSWDEWDEYYKDALYRDSPIRKELDNAILEARKLFYPERFF